MVVPQQFRPSETTVDAALAPQPISGKSSRRVLEPIERISEVLFGLIMALTFTGSLVIATADRAGVREMLLGALGCNLAWGIIDAGMYLLACLHERGRKLLTLRAIRDAEDPAVGQRLVADALPPLPASLLPPEQFEALRRQLRQLPEPPAHPLPTGRDLAGAVAVFLLVFLATLPVVLPFVLVGDPRLALRASNAVAVAMLFVCGYGFGRCTGIWPLGVGAAMVVVGVALVAIAIALGG
jgi:hypothetical protein